MKLSPREIDKMMVSMAAIVARKRLDRGVKLNYPEAVSIISDYVVEGARDGKSVADCRSADRSNFSRWNKVSHCT